MQVSVFNTKGSSIIKHNTNMNLNNFYMVGDNPPVDIQGANISNFVSILVRYS
jgi:ribonucleotide monophosphatase NagD (HAD superfamily)